MSQRDDMDWLRILAIVAVFFIVMLVIAGCQLFDSDKSFDSKCVAKCEDCKGLQLECDHIRVDETTYTQNHPSEPHDTNKEGTEHASE